MNNLPEHPTHQSAQYALEQLTGPKECILHLHQYINDLAQTIPTVDHPAKTKDTDVHDTSTQQEDSKAKSKQKVLIIEDDVAINEMINTFIENAGFQALRAETGRVGISLALEHIPDLIICDIHLPGMHGLEVIRQLKAKAQLVDVPLIMLTADLFRADESFDIGADEYILKPIRKNQLMKHVYKYLERNT